MPDRRVPPNAGGKKIAGISTKWWLVGGGAAALIVYYSYRKSSATTAAVPAPLPDTTDPTGGYADTGNYYGSVDPVTGSPYGGIGNTTLMTPPLAQTNADWYAHAIAALEQHGYTAGATKALAEYLMGLPMSAEDLATVQAAIALVGPPPQYVAAQTVQTPPKTGSRFTQFLPPPQPQLSIRAISGHRAQATATKVARAVGYQWQMGTGVPSPSVSNVHTSGSYKAGQHYGPLRVRAVNIVGRPGPWSNAVSIVLT